MLPYSREGKYNRVRNILSPILPRSASVLALLSACLLTFFDGRYETGRTKMFLKHFHLDELEARIWEIAMAARRIQRAWKVFNTRRKAALFLGAVESAIRPFVERVKRQRAEDSERKNDLLRQIEETRIFGAERRRQEREAAAEAERKQMEEDRAKLEASCRASQEELLRMINALKEKMGRKEDVRDDLTALYQKLSDREKMVEEQFALCRTKIGRLRVDLVRTGKESEDSQAKRDEVVAKMAYVGGPLVCMHALQNSAHCSAQHVS